MTDTTKTEHDGPIEFDGNGVTWRLLTGPTLGREFTDARPGDVIAALSANPQLRAAVLDALGHWETGLQEKLRAAESALEATREDRRIQRVAKADAEIALNEAQSALAAARLENSDLSYQLGKAQGEAEGHALARKGLEAELAAERARVVAAEAMVEEQGRKLWLIREWTDRFGADMKPTGADTYGNGKRDAKKQVSRILASRPAEQASSSIRLDMVMVRREGDGQLHFVPRSSMLPGDVEQPAEQAKGWHCPKCGASDLDDEFFSPTTREAGEAERDDLKRQLEEAKVRRDDDLAIMGQKLIDAQESHSKLFAQLEAAQAELQAIRGELNEWGFWKPSGDIMSVKQLINAYCDLDAKLESAQASAVDLGELEHLRESCAALSAQVDALENLVGEATKHVESDTRAEWLSEQVLALRSISARDQKRAAPVVEEPECVCLMPFDTKPGPHHALHCPQRREPAAAQPSPAQVATSKLAGVDSFQERLLANGTEMLAVTREALKLYERIASALDRLAPVPIWERPIPSNNEPAAAQPSPGEYIEKESPEELLRRAKAAAADDALGNERLGIALRYTQDAVLALIQRSRADVTTIVR